VHENFRRWRPTFHDLAQRGQRLLSTPVGRHDSRD
jgi:hypothetical protein